MAHNTTRPGLESRGPEEILSSPVARAFVRTVVARRGITEAEARRIYLDYLNRVPTDASAPAAHGCAE
jgi:predicted LPLAT superfamily acyltransferase